jgi:hypothetical protein
MKLLKHLVLTFSLILTLCSCGSFSSFKSTHAPVLLEQNKTAYIQNIFCNTQHCEETTNEVHLNLQQNLKDSLKNIYSLNISNDKKNSDYRFYIISAFEEDIEHHMPRNIYVVVKDKKDQELFQFGLAESFSTPMTDDYLSVKAVQDKFNYLVHTSFTSPVVITKK